MFKLIVLIVAGGMALIASPSAYWFITSHSWQDRVVGSSATVVIAMFMTVAWVAAAELDKNCRGRKKRISRGIRFYQK